MKYIILTLLLYLTAFAQEETNSPPNIAVKYWGAGNTNGYPESWPMRIEYCGTNLTWAVGWVVFTPEAYANLIATNAAEMAVAKSNKTYTTTQTISNNLAALVTAYSNLQWCADNWASVTNIATLRIAVKAEGDVLLKLKPVLQQLYKGQ